MRWIFLALFVMMGAGCGYRGSAIAPDANTTTFAYHKGGVRYAYAHDEELARRGFPKARAKIAFLIYRGLVAKPRELMLEYARYAYRHGVKKAAIILADEALKKGEMAKAARYLGDIDPKELSFGEWREYVLVALRLKEPYRSQLLGRVEKEAQNNPKAAYGLAWAYEEQGLFDKAIRFYEVAFKKGRHIESGVRLGRLYLERAQQKKGLYILRRIAKKDDGRAARIVGHHLYERLQERLRRMNTPPISFVFVQPKEFFDKKLRIRRYEERYMEKNVIPWYRLAYERGNIEGMLDLIALDIGRDNLVRGKSFSGFDLEEAIKFLQSLQKSWRARLILAKIYEKYTHLGRVGEAKRIYEEYLAKDKVDAYWHLYQYAKRFEPANVDKYLDYLVGIRFVPAMIEKAYLELLERKNIGQNHKILRYYADAGHIVAMRYLASIYTKKIIPGVDPIQGCRLLKKIAAIDYPLNTKLDLKIADCYLRIYPKRDILRPATIMKFYALLGRPEAKYALAKLYKDYFEDYKMVQRYLRAAKDDGYKDAVVEYYRLVMRGDIEGDIKEAIAFLEKEAAKTPLYYLLLAEAYWRGYPLDIDLDRAVFYYKEAIRNGSLEAYYHLARLYGLYDIAGEYKDRIVGLLGRLIQKSRDHLAREARYYLAAYHEKLGEFEQAKEVLLEVLRLWPRDPKARMMLYRLTGDERYLSHQKRKESDFGPLLVAKAKSLKDRHPSRALFLAFRAMLCRTPQAHKVAYKIILHHFTSPKRIYSIYQQAKRSRPCYVDR
jgi:TPR repeat protein